MKDLISKLNKGTKLIIGEKQYVVKTKTWYSITEDESASYMKCELSEDKVLVIIPDDELICLGSVIDNMNFERISETEIKYDGKIFEKTGDGHQFITNIEFGDEHEIEGKCIFEDYECENIIISLGILTEKENKRADVYADILDINEILIK